MEDVDEVAGAISAGDLAIAEEIGGGEDVFLEEAAAFAGVGFGAVVAVGEVEEVDVPLVGVVVGVEELAGAFEGGGDFGAAIFAEVVEGLFVDVAGLDVVDDVAGFDAFVIAAEPGVDPEGFDADELFLLIAHVAGDVHHVDDDGVGLGGEDFFPGAEAFVVFDGDDDGIGGVVEAEHDLAFEGFTVGAFEVFEGFGADAADAGVFVADGGDLLAAFGFDAGEVEFFAEDVGEFFEGDIDFHEVLAGLIAALFAVALADGLAFFAIAGADAAGVVAVAEGGDFDAVDGDGDEVLAFFADEFAAGEEFAEVAADAAFDDLAEALVVLVDHGGLLNWLNAFSTTGSCVSKFYEASGPQVVGKYHEYSLRGHFGRNRLEAFEIGEAGKRLSKFLGRSSSDRLAYRIERLAGVVRSPVTSDFLSGSPQQCELRGSGDVRNALELNANRQNGPRTRGIGDQEGWLA